MIKLIVKHDALYLPSGGILLYVYPAGDCDRIAWPLTGSTHYPEAKERALLAGALFDECECGSEIGPERAVLLPDGTRFDIDEELARAEESGVLRTEDPDPPFLAGVADRMGSRSSS